MVISVEVDLNALASAVRELDRVVPLFEAYLERKVVPRVDQRTIGRLKDMPPSPDYPLVWKSEKQRRYVMAKLRRENNLPYKRTGRLVEGWAVRLAKGPSSYKIEVLNPAGKVLDYVAGEGEPRQPMFPKWYVYPDILRQEGDTLRKELVAYFKRRAR